MKPVEPHPHAEPAPAEAPVPSDRASQVAHIFREHNRILIGLLVGRLHNEQDAMEVAQEAYVKVLQLEPKEGAVSYLPVSSPATA